MPAEAAAGAIGGATPFGWAGLAASLLGGAARPAGPSSADAMFGPSMFSVDSSNWMVNFGDGANQSLTAGPKTGPSMTAPQNYEKPTQAPTYVMPAGGSGAGSIPYSAINPPAAGGAVGGIPILWVVIGLGVVLLWKKR